MSPQGRWPELLCVLLVIHLTPSKSVFRRSPLSNRFIPVWLIVSRRHWNGKESEVYTKESVCRIYKCWLCQTQCALFTVWTGNPALYRPNGQKIKLEIAQSEQDVSPCCKESDMTYSWKRQFVLFSRDLFSRIFERKNWDTRSKTKRIPLLWGDT